MPGEANEFVIQAIDMRKESYIYTIDLRLNAKPEFVNLFWTTNTISRN